MPTEIYADLTDGSRFWLAEGLDDRREAVSGLELPWSKTPQVVHGVEADTVSVFDRGGVQQAVSFTVTRLFDSKALARRYALGHAENHGKLPGKMTFIHHDEEGPDRWELVGHLTAARPAQHGITVFISYEMIGATWKRPDPD